MSFAHKNRITDDGKMSFAPKHLAPAPKDIAGQINEKIDEALVLENRQQEPRTYLGGSLIGEECQRKLAFHYHAGRAERARFEADPKSYLAAPRFEGRILRRFRLGHLIEDEVASMLRLAGFKLHTENAKGYQFSWGTARDLVTGENRLKGHIDGWLEAGPIALPYALLWECKVMKSNKWAATERDGVRKVYPVYFGQMQTYMAYLEFRHALFTAYNSDTSELLFELVPFDERAAQEYTDTAVAVLRSKSPYELPRMTSDPAYYKCKWCDFYKRCWDEAPDTDPVAVIDRPPWL